MMANVLNVALIESIQALFAQGWSRRRIARELGVDRETVGKYVSQGLAGQNQPNLPTGSDAPKPATLLGLPAPAPAEAVIGGLAGFEIPKPATDLPTGSATPAERNIPTGPASKCEPFREVIVAKLAAGLTAQRIHQDLGGKASGFGYDSVRRFIQRLGRVPPAAVPPDGMRSWRGSPGRFRYGRASDWTGPLSGRCPQAA